MIRSIVACPVAVNMKEKLRNKHLIEKTWIFVAVCILGYIQPVLAQDLSFRTIYGIVQITGVLNDSAIVAKSNKLFILLDYETARFILKLEKSTLKTGVDSLDQLLAKREDDFIRYEGKLGIDYIQSESHEPQDFVVNGYLTCADHNELIEGKGRLDHLFAGEYACMLTMTFHINLSDIHYDIGIPGLHDEIQIEILKTVLDKIDN